MPLELLRATAGAVDLLEGEKPSGLVIVRLAGRHREPAVCLRACGVHDHDAGRLALEPRQTVEDGLRHHAPAAIGDQHDLMGEEALRQMAEQSPLNLLVWGPGVALVDPGEQLPVGADAALRQGAPARLDEQATADPSAVERVGERLARVIVPDDR